MIAAATIVSGQPVERYTMALTGDSIVTRKLSVYEEPEFLEMIELIRSADVAFTNVEILFRVDRRYHTVAIPPEPVSQELRQVEFEIASPENFTGMATIPAYALYYVCEDVDGTCLFRRQDVHVELSVN